MFSLIHEELKAELIYLIASAGLKNILTSTGNYICQNVFTYKDMLPFIYWMALKMYCLR